MTREQHRARGALRNVPRAELDTALAEMARRTAVAKSVAESLKGQLAVLDRLLRSRTSWVVAWDEARGHLGVVAVRGRSEARVEAVKSGEGAVGRAFSEGKRQVEGTLEAMVLRGPIGPIGAWATLGARTRLSPEALEIVTAQLSAAWQVGQLRDDSARRGEELEKAVAGLRQLERTREQLLSHVSHELKNPLTSLKTYVGLMRRERLGPITPQQASALETADRNADALARMINDLLLMSQLRSGEMTLNARPYGLRALAAETVERLLETARLQGLQLLPVQGAEAFVRGDRERTGEALTHLLETAMDQATDGSSLGLVVSARTSTVSLEITVKGRTLSEADSRALFEGFSRLRSSSRLGRGTGLGLPIAARILELHSGRVELRPREEGTAFEITLPIYAGVVPSPSAGATAAGTILVVEDDADCRRALVDLLELEGFAAASVASVSAAVAWMERERPSMVLLDHVLGDGSGQRVLRHVRQEARLANVPVFVVSGAPDAARLTTGQGVDRVDGYLEKPVQAGRLMDAVRSLVAPRRPRSLSASSGTPDR
jgi:signal transduction histidine kinase/ActR/RegA family two-component response regulator